MAVRRGRRERGAGWSEHMRQVGAGRGLGRVGPQQAGQLFAGVGALGLDRQVGQQGAHLVRLEGGDGLPVEGRLERAQQREGKARQGTLLLRSSIDQRPGLVKFVFQTTTAKEDQFRVS